MKIEIDDSKLVAIVGRIIKRQGKKLQHIRWVSEGIRTPDPQDHKMINMVWEFFGLVSTVLFYLGLRPIQGN